MSEVKSFNQWMVDQGFNAIRHANCCRIAYEGGQQSMQAEIDRLNSVLDERTKEWLQAIECGTYFENVAKPLKAENDSLKTQLNNMEACYIGKKKQVEAVSQVLCELKESLKDFQEMDLYDKGYRVTTEYVIADLEQALRGEHANPN